MEKKINLQMTYSQFSEILIFSLNNEDVPELYRFSQILQAKIDKMIEHDLYTKYKTSPTKEQKERARKEYLEKKCIPNKFRW